MLPNEEIKTFTELEQYFNFNEKKYEILDVDYFLYNSLLDENFEEILEKDAYHDMTKVIYTKGVDSVSLDYDSDILPYLTGEFEYNMKKVSQNDLEKKIKNVVGKIIDKINFFL